jgi:hypothetical protein
MADDTTVPAAPLASARSMAVCPGARRSESGVTITSRTAGPPGCGAVGVLPSPPPQAPKANATVHAITAD